MIIGNIELLRLEIQNNPQKKDVLPDVTFAKENDIPTSFYFNGSWKIAHPCSKCEKTIEFGLETDGLKDWIYSFKQVKPINTKNYTIEVINRLHDLIPETILSETEQGLFLGLEGEFDPSFPFSTSLKLNYYRCKNCDQLHFMIGYVLFGEMPERSNEMGQNDQWVVNQIIGVSVNDVELIKLFVE